MCALFSVICLVTESPAENMRGKDKGGFPPLQHTLLHFHRRKARCPFHQVHNRAQPTVLGAGASLGGLLGSGGRSGARVF